MRILDIARRECGIIKSHPVFWLAMVVFPLLTMVFFTSLMEEGQPEDMPIGVVDCDNSTTSRKLIRNLDAFQTSHVVARYADIGEARHAIQRNEIYAFLYIPHNMEGEVSEIYPKLGELVGTGSPIMSVAILSDVWGTFNVREDMLNGLKVGDTFTAYLPAFSKDIEMKVYYIKDQGSYAAWKATKANGQYDLKTFEVKARLVKPTEGLRPGMSLILKR